MPKRSTPLFHNQPGISALLRRIFPFGYTLGCQRLCAHFECRLGFAIIYYSADAGILAISSYPLPAPGSGSPGSSSMRDDWRR